MRTDILFLQSCGDRHFFSVLVHLQCRERVAIERAMEEQGVEMLHENVRQFMPRGVAVGRTAEAISFEQFCVADAGEEWISRTVLPNAMTILTYPRCVMVCSSDGSCTLVKQHGTNAHAYFIAALEVLDEVA